MPSNTGKGYNSVRLTTHSHQSMLPYLKKNESNFKEVNIADELIPCNANQDGDIDRLTTLTYLATNPQLGRTNISMMRFSVLVCQRRHNKSWYYIVVT